jgi:hypothetical protein
MGMEKEQPMRWFRSVRWWAILGAVALAAWMGGDRGAFSASAANSGTDPFDVLDLQVKPYVGIIFDTSGSMKFAPNLPPGDFRFPVGGDDPTSRMWQAKRALRDVAREFRTRLNMGLYSFSPLTTDKRLTSGQSYDGDSSGRRDGPFVYVSNSPGARLFGWDPNNNGQLDDPADTYTCVTVGGTTIKSSGYFCDIENAVADYNNQTSADVFQSFGNRGYHSVPYPWKARTGSGWGGTSPASPTWKSGTDATSIIGYSGTYPNGRLFGATGATTPEAQPSTATNGSYRVPECNPLLNECKYFLQSRVYRTDVKYLWDLNNSVTAAASKLVGTQAFDCSTVPPPVGMTDDTIVGPRPCVVMADSADPNNPDRYAVFYYSSAIWQNSTGGGCQDPVKLVDVPPCSPSSLSLTAADNVDSRMGLELPMAGTDRTTMLPTAVGTAITTSPTATAPDLNNLAVSNVGEGIRSDGGTPLYNALDYVRNNNVFPVPPTGLPAGAVQKRYILVITDGENNCNSLTGFAQAAHDVYASTNNQRQAELFLVVFTSDASAINANYVAQAGSGAVSPSGFNDSTASETLSCPSGANCRNAIRAFNIDDLKVALRNAFSSIANSGEYASARGTVVDRVYEFAAVAGTPYTANDPVQRYATSLDVVLQSNFAMPGFRGLLRAYRADPSGTGVLAWEAGANLNARVSGTMGAVSCPGIPAGGVAACSGEYTFAELHGGSVPGPKYTPSTSARIRRRIFTTERNGVNPAIVPLWPPTTDNAGVAPSDTVIYPPGKLDGSAADGVGLAIGGLTFADLQTTFDACEGFAAQIPADCTDPAKQLGRAMKEAREIILAFTAGAEVSRDLTGVLRRDAAGEVLYKARSWVLAESTVATPAIVGPPADAQPDKHSVEYRFYLDGFRDVDNRLIGTSQVENGFGLRNPDLDDPTALTDPEKKPLMTVAYLPTNHMLHAFRAGPQSCATAAACPPSGSEGGGDELWAYVPFDLLSKLQTRRRGQIRTDPVYMMSSSLRVGDIYIPGSYVAPDGRTYAGKWRTFMFAGRGPGGKYISALDITGTGPFTRNSLETGLPTVYWNRGNPDTIDGSSTGTASATTAPADRGATDLTAYAQMGETWSVGSLVPVDPARAYGQEWIYWVGSGFSDAAAEGHTFYTLDAVTGDVLYSADVGSNASAGRTNFLSANVVGYVPERFDCTRSPGERAIDGRALSGYVGDLHGRIWKFSVTALSTPQLVQDFGVNQPLGAGLSVLDVTTAGVPRTYIYGGTGADNRVAVPPAATPPFKLFALADSGTAFTSVFSKDLPERFRGTVQPLVVDSCDSTAKKYVFYAGTQYTPAVASTNCASAFDSIFYALDAASGIAAFNLNAVGASTQEYAIWRNQKVTNIRGSGGKVTLDVGIDAGAPPPAPAPPAPRAPFAVPAVNVLNMRFGSPVCN